jgi:hypothetical protein
LPFGGTSDVFNVRSVAVSQCALFYEVMPVTVWTFHIETGFRHQRYPQIRISVLSVCLEIRRIAPLQSQSDEIALGVNRLTLFINASSSEFDGILHSEHNGGVRFSSPGIDVSAMFESFLRVLFAIKWSM